MNNEQQKLYDKLLKKVNEYCLGAAAEDVIEAIDNLVDAYENFFTELATVREGYQNCMKEWESGHSVDFSKVRFEVQNLLPDPDDIGKRIKALEIIKEKQVEVYSFCRAKDLEHYNETVAKLKVYYLTEEEYKILKEILK